MALLILFYPAFEIYSYYKFIEAFGFLDLLFFLLSGGALGLLIMSVQGRATLQTVQLSLMKGEVPTARVFHRGLIMFGGFLIFLPGLLSKALGTLLVLPGTRHLAALYLKWALAKKLVSGSFRVFTATPPPPPPMQDSRDVIEVQPLEVEHTPGKKDNQGL